MLVLSSKTAKILAVVFICLVGFIAYSNSFHNSFHFDDEEYIMKYVPVHSLNVVEGVWKTRNDRTRVVTFITLALNYHFGRFDTFGYHVVNFIIHMSNAVLVWWLTQLIFLTPKIKNSDLARHRDTASFIAGIIFISHPVQTQAVTYIIQRFASLATLFYLLTMCLYVQARLTQKSSDNPYFRTYLFIGAGLSAFLGMFTKEITYTLPLMILFFELYFMDLSIKKIVRTKKFFIFVAVSLLFAFAVAYYWKFNFSFIFGQRESQSFDGDILTTKTYFLTQFRSLSIYFKLLLFPIGQNLDYDFPASKGLLVPITTLFGGLLVLAVAIAGFLTRKKYVLISFGIFWFFIAASIESSIIAIQNVFFEHRVYLPFVGFSIIMAYFLAVCFRHKTVKILAVAIIVGTLTYLTYQRNIVWTDDVTLWEDVIKKAPLKARAYNNLGKAYFAKGNYTKSFINLNKALELDSEFVAALVNRGLLYFRRDEFDKSLADYQKALDLQKDFVPALNNRGLLYIKLNKFDLAIADFQNIINQQPSFAEAYKNIGDALFLKGDFLKALEYFNTALKMYRNFPDALNNRGLLLFRLDKYEEALTDFNRALQIRPDYLESLNNRAILYTKIGKYDLAMKDYVKALAIDKQNVKTYTNRGITYASMGDREAAIRDFTIALSFDPMYMKAYFNRGNEYAKTSQFDLAIKDYDRVLQLDPNNAIIYFNRSQLFRMQNKIPEALKDALKANSLGKPVDPEYLKSLNDLLSGKKETK